MLEVVIILVVLAVAAVAMVLWARRRNLPALSSQETVAPDPVRDRPAGPAAESMDPDDTGGHASGAG